MSATMILNQLKQFSVELEMVSIHRRVKLCLYDYLGSSER